MRADHLEGTATAMLLGMLAYDVVRGAPFRAIGADVDVSCLFAGPRYGPPAPRPWHEMVNWRQVLGGEPLELYGGEW